MSAWMPTSRRSASSSRRISCSSVSTDMAGTSGSGFAQHRIDIVAELHVAARERIVAARCEIEAALRAAGEIGVAVGRVAPRADALDHAGKPALRVGRIHGLLRDAGEYESGIDRKHAHPELAGLRRCLRGDARLRDLAGAVR